MCILNGRTTKRRTGFKVLAYIDGKFYSTFTGQRIKIGKIPNPPKKCKRLSNNWNSILDHSTLRSCWFYHKTFIGKTSAFIRLKSADVLYNDMKFWIISDNVGTKIVLTKITFDNITYTGKYDDDNIIASDIIKSIEIIK